MSSPDDAPCPDRIRWRQGRRLWPFLLCSALLLSLATPAAAGREALLTEAVDDYAAWCQSCHGPEGRGDGSMAEILVRPPSDLTAIAARREGVFPFWQIYALIEGEQAVAGHETFQMPLFGQRLRRDEGKPGYLPAPLRILLLTHYLEAMQAPASAAKP